MPPTFLFLLYKIVKEQTVSKPSKTHPLNSATQSQSSEPSGPNSQSRLAPSLRCRVSNPQCKPCQPIFFKKFTALSTVPSSIHQQSFHPANAAKPNNQNLNLNRLTQLQGRNILSLATLAALGERHIDPTQQICQRSFIKKYKVSFHRQNQATLPNINQPNQHDSKPKTQRALNAPSPNSISLYIIALSAAAG